MDVRIENLTIRYKDKTAIRNFSAVFPSGKTSVIMGPSGCGKTTLLHMLMGIVPATEGNVTGIPARIAPVFQEDRLCEDLSAVANVRLVLRRKSEESKILSALNAAGLEDSADKPVRELSGGMQRRVAVIRALLADSQMILMDEPFKGLDTSTKEPFIEFVKSRIIGKTAVIVTHDEREAILLGGTVLRMTMPTNEDSP